MATFKDFLDNVNKLRIVKYGDIVLSSDHNDIVYALRTLSDLLCPSKIDPYEKYPNARVIDHAFSSSVGSTTLPSLICIKKESDFFAYDIVYFSTPICNTIRNPYVENKVLSESENIICLKINKVSPPSLSQIMPIFGVGIYVDFVTLDVTSANPTTIEYTAMASIVYFYYKEDNKVYEYIFFTDHFEGISNKVDILPDDWHFVKITLGTPQGSIEILDKNDNVLASFNFSVSVRQATYTDTSPRVAVIYGAGSDFLYPNSVWIDWFVQILP